MRDEKEFRKVGRYIVTAKRWSHAESHNYLVDLCEGIDQAIEVADKEANERGGKYGIQVYAFSNETNDCDLVYESVSPYKDRVKNLASQEDNSNNTQKDETYQGSDLQM